MTQQVELLAPGGDVDSIKAAIAAGADAVYCGAHTFNARSKATNIEFDDLQGIIKLAHENECEVFFTLNIIIIEEELHALVNLLNKLAQTEIDAVIVQDIGLLYLLKNHFKNLTIHASTQLTTHNRGQIDFLKKLGVERVNLCRELNLDEIRSLTSYSHQCDIKTEVFVHGSYCISFSGLCYMSSIINGKSGNRGRCSQPCRSEYQTTAQGVNFPLNLKDNSALFDLGKLHDAGVDSFKIEGRIKGFDYVYTVVHTYRQQIDNLHNNNQSATNQVKNLYTVFNRDFSNAFLDNNINKKQFIDNPRDYSLQKFKKAEEAHLNETKLTERKEYNAKKQQFSTIAKNKMAELHLEDLPFKMPPACKRGKLFSLPKLIKEQQIRREPRLSILISSIKDIPLLETKNAQVLFQLPSCFANATDHYVTLFTENRQLIPYFPPLLIEENYDLALKILQGAKPQTIVSNNLGLSMEASILKIPWIAGPHLNIVNSYSLLCLKELFHCSGAFISSELNKKQIEAIVPPAEFSLYFSIYHPIPLITSRQCLHHQIVGCEKERIDLDCLSHCDKSSTLTDKNQKKYFVHKQIGEYHTIYNDHNYLNTKIISDLPDIFSNFLIDLRDIRTETDVHEQLTDKKQLVHLFKKVLAGKKKISSELHQKLSPSFSSQYIKGI